MESFRTFRGLMNDMAVWDAQETRAQGYDSAALLAEGYAGSAADMLAHFTAPGAALFLALMGDQIAGCAGFSRAGGRADVGMAEVEKVYVGPEFRGLGIGAALLSAVLTGIRACGYASVRLETANFMTAAQTLYRRHGFAEVAAFRPSIGNTGDMSVFMQCDLRARGAVPDAP